MKRKPLNPTLTFRQKPDRTAPQRRPPPTYESRNRVALRLPGLRISALRHLALTRAVLTYMAVLGGLSQPACLKKGPPKEKDHQAEDAYRPVTLNNAQQRNGRAKTRGARHRGRNTTRPRTRPRPRRRPGGKAVVHLGYEPPHLNLFLQEDYWISRLVINNIQEALVRVDPASGDIRPLLAEKWHFENNGRRLVLKLRSGVRFHDGKPLTGKDVAFTFAVLKDPQRAAAALRQDFKNIRSFQVQGDTITLELARPDFKILSSLAHLPILPRHVYGAADFKKHPANLKPVGSGPFKIGEWKRGTALTLERWAGYWGRNAYLEKLVFRVVRDKRKAFALLEKGEIDLITRVPLNLVCQKNTLLARKTFKQKFRVKKYYPNSFHSLILNAATPQLTNRRVREALVRLTDRKLLAQKLLCSHARIISGPFWPGRPGYDASLKPRPYDLQKGSAALTAAGWKDRDGDGVREKGGKKLRLVYLQIAESALQRRLGPLLQQAYKKAGIQMVIKRVPFSRWLQLVRKNRFHLADIIWTFYGEQDLYQHYACSQREGGSNYGNFCNQKADRLLRRIRRTLDDHKRHLLERKLHRLLYKQVPAVYLFNTARVSVSAMRLRGAHPTPEGFIWKDLWMAGGAR